jgi:pyridoxamine 5'-phosphate oxidase family protein
VALVVDDVLAPFQPRCVMVRGRGEALPEAVGVDGASTGAMIRITPTQVISFGLATA